MRAARILVGRGDQEENASDLRSLAISVERLTPYPSSLQREDRCCAVTASARIGQHSREPSRSLFELDAVRTRSYLTKKSFSGTGCGVRSKGKRTSQQLQSSRDHPDRAVVC
jgi:hypothetical protein